MGIPVQVIFVNIEVGHILLGIPVEACVNHTVKGAIQLIISKQCCFLLDLFVIVNDLVNVNVILAVGIVEDDKLTGNGGHDFCQSNFHRGQKEICILLRHHHIQAQIIFKIFSRHTKLHIQTVCRQAMYTERINDLHCHRLISGLRECAGDDVFKLPACSDNSTDSRFTLEKTVGLNSRPVVIERDNTRCVLRHGCIEDTFDGGGDILQDMAVLNQVQLVENINVRRMDREQIHELFQTGGHACIETTELLQVIADQCFLLRRFFQDTLGNDIGSCFLRDDHLREAVTDVLERISNKAEFRVVENLLLHTEHHAQRRLRTHLAQGAEEFQIKNDLEFITGGQVGQELIHDDEISLVRILLGEGNHHVLDDSFDALNALVARHFKVDAAFFKIVLHIAHDDIIERHYYAANLNAQNFKLASNRLNLLGKLFVLEIMDIIHIGRNSGENAHQVRFTGTIVTDNQHALVVYHFVHLKLIQHRSLQALCHGIGHNVGLYVFTRLVLVFSRNKLDNILYRMERN